MDFMTKQIVKQAKKMLGENEEKITSFFSQMIEGVELKENEKSASILLWQDSQKRMLVSMSVFNENMEVVRLIDTIPLIELLNSLFDKVK